MQNFDGNIFKFNRKLMILERIEKGKVYFKSFLHEMGKKYCFVFFFSLRNMLVFKVPKNNTV